MPIKLSVAPQQFVDENGKPIVGRVLFWKHGSNELATIYTMQGNSFQLADNPQLLNAMGSIDETVFFDADILDMRVERYIGAPGAMDPLSPQSDWALFDEFQVGMDYKALAEQTGTVNSIAELKETDPAEFKVVEVQDVPFRRYVWDRYATNNADDGVVVMSGVTSDGRWLLLWDDDTLPSEVYGVEGGNYANLGMLLSYPATVGSIGLATPPRVRIARGTYATSSWVSTDKTVVFQNGVRFTGGGLIAPRFEQLNEMDNYFADVRVTDQTASVHSSWFRTAMGFWTSDAKELYIDETNYFADSRLAGQVRLDDARIHGSTRLPVTYATGAYLYLSGCSYDARGIFTPSLDYIRFARFVWDDKIWTSNVSSQYDFGTIANGNHIQYTSMDMNVLTCALFARAETYVRMRVGALIANPSASQILDLEGRSIGSFSETCFTKLMNCHVTGSVNLAGTVSGFTMQNVEVEGQVDGGTDPVCVNVIAKWVGEWTGSLTCSNCTISGNTVTHAHDITFVGGRWMKSIDNASDNTADTGTIIFRDCVVDGLNAKLHTKNLNFIRCGIYEQDIKVYPTWKDDLGKFVFQGRLEHCEVSGSKPIAYGIFHGLGDNCKDCILLYTWIGNSFFGNTEGLTFEFWADSSVLAEVLDLTGHTVVYSGNSGNCPLEAWHGTYGPISWASCAMYPKDGDSPLTGYYRAALAVRCCPPWNGTITQAGTFGNWMGPSYEISGGASTKSYSAATNPMPSSLGYGDAFGSYFVRYGSTGDTALIYV